MTQTLTISLSIAALLTIITFLIYDYFDLRKCPKCDKKFRFKTLDTQAVDTKLYNSSNIKQFKVKLKCISCNHQWTFIKHNNKSDF